MPSFEDIFRSKTRSPSRFRAKVARNQRSAHARAKPQPKDGLSQFQRYCQAQTDRGMKLLCVWVPDPTRPEFAKEAARPAPLLRGRPEEADALTFIETVFPWPEK